MADDGVALLFSGLSGERTMANIVQLFGTSQSSQLENMENLPIRYKSAHGITFSSWVREFHIDNNTIR
jgi:DNA-binding transcriptional regulator YbjK